MSSSSSPAAPVLAKDQDKTAWCLNTTAVRDFLRMSRGVLDDSISARLNSQVTPGSSNPFASSTPVSTQASYGDRRNVPEDSCAAFKHSVLFPGWSTRDSVLAVCGSVANKTQTKSPSAGPAAARNYWGAEQVVNERLDPYSARDYEWVRFSQADQLHDVLQNERRTESIVRSRSWAVLGERCAGGASANWRDEYQAWASRQAP